MNEFAFCHFQSARQTRIYKRISGSFVYVYIVWIYIYIDKIKMKSERIEKKRNTELEDKSHTVAFYSFFVRDVLIHDENG